MKVFGMERFKNLMKMAADDGGSGSGGADDKADNKAEDKGTGEEGKGGDSDKDKTFTQEDLTRIAATEKAQGRKAALKDLGFESEEDAKKDLKAYQLYKQSLQTDKEKSDAIVKGALDTASAEKARADNVEQKLEAITAGALPTAIDDLVIIARAKMSDSVNFKQALEEVKKVYPNFFGEENGANRGTGGSGNNPRTPAGKGSVEGIGKRLGQGKSAQSAQSEGNKNPYFSKN